MKNNIKQIANEIVQKYLPVLEQNGIKCTISQKYFESKIHEPFNDPKTTEMINKEECENYRFQNNRYKVLVLRFEPADKKVKSKNCREYAFLIEKTERPALGRKPRQWTADEEALAMKIEKLLEKIIKKSEKAMPEKLCKNNIFDYMRYHFGAKYLYKKNSFER